MDNITFKLKNLEFHLKEKSIKHEECVANAIKLFLETKTDIEVAIAPCRGLENELNKMLSDYEKLNSSK